MAWITGKCEGCSVVFSDYGGYITNLSSTDEILSKVDVPKIVKEHLKLYSVKPYGFLDPCPICKKVTPFIVIEDLSDI